MQSCGIHHWVLFSLTLTFSSGPTLASTSVTVKFNQPATLPCNYKCSGSAKWTMFHNPGFILAQCNQNTCRSEKGYEMSHDQYMEGKLYLTITAADYSKRALYTCDCDGVEACGVRLIIDTIMSSVKLNPGEALVMDLPIPEPMEVMYKPMDSAGLYGVQICTVIQRSLQCEADYTLRTSLRYTNIILRDVNVSDSGLYTIRDKKNDEVIHIYTLVVKVVQPESEGTPVIYKVFIVIAGILLLALIIVGAVVLAKRLEIKRLKQEKADLEETIQLNKSEPEEAKSRQRANSDADMVIKQMVEVEKLIRQCTVEPRRRSLSLNDIPVLELLKKKMAETDELVQHRGNSGQGPVCQWWSLRRPELDTIIEYWNTFDTNPDQGFNKQ